MSASGDNVYELASRALADAQEEARQWRMRAEDAEINLREAQENQQHMRRMLEIQDQIIEQKDLAVASYKHMVEDLQGSGIIARYSEEITGLQAKLKFALSLVPRGDSEVFAFEDGDEAEYGSQTQYSEAMLDYWCQAMPIAMSCINRVQAMICQNERAKETILAAKHAIGKVHERTMVGDEICEFTGQMREKKTWLQEEEDDD